MAMAVLLANVRVPDVTSRKLLNVGPGRVPPELRPVLAAASDVLFAPVSRMPNVLPDARVTADAAVRVVTGRRALLALTARAPLTVPDPARVWAVAAVPPPRVYPLTA